VKKKLLKKAIKSLFDISILVNFYISHFSDFRADMLRRKRKD